MSQSEARDERQRAREERKGSASPAPRAGKGKGSGKKGKGGPKRHGKPKALVANLIVHTLTKPAVRRVIRRAGGVRINGLVYGQAREVFMHAMKKVIHDTLVCTAYTRRTTVYPRDVVHALQQNGNTLYGFGSY